MSTTGDVKAETASVVVVNRRGLDLALLHLGILPMRPVFTLKSDPRNSILMFCTEYICEHGGIYKEAMPH